MRTERPVVTTEFAETSHFQAEFWRLIPTPKLLEETVRMPIEFNCQHCNKRLKVSDQSAGKRAKCPQCQNIMSIPAAGAGFSAAPAPPVAPSPPANKQANPLVQQPAASSNPYNAPTSAGTPNKPIASRKIVPTAVEVGDVISYAWEVWKNNLGLLVGITATVFAITGGIGFVRGFLSVVGQQQGNEIFAFIALGLMLVENIATTFLGIGQAHISLKLLRGQTAQFGDLFGGGPLFLRTLGASIVFGLIVFLGFIALIIPGILLMLFYWPFYYLVVDGKAKAMQSFSMAKPIAKLNVGTAVVLWLASIGIMIAGILAMCVGFLFAAPLVSLIGGAAYLMMSGQLSRKPM